MVFGGGGGVCSSSYVTCLFRCKKHCVAEFKKAEEFNVVLFWSEQKLCNSFLSAASDKDIKGSITPVLTENIDKKRVDLTAAF